MKLSISKNTWTFYLYTKQIHNKKKWNSPYKKRQLQAKIETPKLQWWKTKNKTPAPNENGGFLLKSLEENAR